MRANSAHQGEPPRSRFTESEALKQVPASVREAVVPEVRSSSSAGPAPAPQQRARGTRGRGGPQRTPLPRQRFSGGLQAHHTAACLPRKLALISCPCQPQPCCRTSSQHPSPELTASPPGFSRAPLTTLRQGRPHPPHEPASAAAPLLPPPAKTPDLPRGDSKAGP